MKLFPGKRGKILLISLMTYLADIEERHVFQQETHMSKTSAHTLTSPQFPQMYSACYNSKQRGIAILINRRINFTLTSCVIDPERIFIILNLCIQNIDLCIATTY